LQSRPTVERELEQPLRISDVCDIQLILANALQKRTDFVSIWLFLKMNENEDLPQNRLSSMDLGMNL